MYYSLSLSLSRVSDNKGNTSMTVTNDKFSAKPAILVRLVQHFELPFALIFFLSLTVCLSLAQLS